MTDSIPLSRIWWLWVPLGFMAAQVAAEIFLPYAVLGPLHSENGPHELLQFLVMAAAAAVAVRALFLIDWKTQIWLGLWFALAAMCCLYVAGEELSWGQQILKWNTPEYWSALNDQNETNFHNTSSWLDQKPRLILEIGIIFGGLILPFFPRLAPRKFVLIYPPRELAVVALGVILPKLADKIGEAFGVVLFARVSEVQELFMFYFVLLYLTHLGKKIR